MYDPDLADVQHLGFSDQPQRMAPGLLRLLEAAGIRSGRVVDLGCGDGTWLAALDAAGFEAVGVDISPALVRHARRTAPSARIHVGSLYDFEIPDCVAVTAISEVLTYVPPGARRRPGLAPVFRRAFRALAPGGLLVFDLFERHRTHRIDTRNFREGRGWAVMAASRENASGTRLVREITTFRRTAGGRYRRRHETHRVEISDRAAVSASLRRAGFRATSGRSFGGIELAPRRIGFVARRPTRP